MTLINMLYRFLMIYQYIYYEIVEISSIVIKPYQPVLKLCQNIFNLFKVSHETMCRCFELAPAIKFVYARFSLDGVLNGRKN